MGSTESKLGGGENPSRVKGQEEMIGTDREGDAFVGDGPGFKYGALVFSPPPGPPGLAAMSDGKVTFEGDVRKMVPESDHVRWREWIGSVAWDDIGRSNRVVVARVRSDGPEVLGGEDDLLQRQMRGAWVAFLLTGAVQGDPSAWILTGRARGLAPGAQFASIGSALPQDRVVLPLHETRRRYVEIQAERIRRHWAEHGAHDESWFPRWIELEELLARRVPRPPLLAYALLAYLSARTRTLLEFSIPEFVRAAEGVIALPPRTGRTLFRDRALALVPHLRDDEYVGAEVEALLLDLYDLRSDCTHGKIPFEVMSERADAGVEQAAKLGYVAELVARELLLRALRRPDWSVFASREEIQSAWDGGAFP